MAFKSKPTCMECSHVWIDVRHGNCRKRAPTTNPATGAAVWPAVSFNSWCGEWAPGPTYGFDAPEQADFEK